LFLSDQFALEWLRFLDSLFACKLTSLGCAARALVSRREHDEGLQ
jgi:hypothetical protein